MEKDTLMIFEVGMKVKTLVFIL